MVSMVVLTAVLKSTCEIFCFTLPSHRVGVVVARITSHMHWKRVRTCGVASKGMCKLLSSVLNKN